MNRKLSNQVALACFAIAASQALGIVALSPWWWWSGIALGLFFRELGEVLS